MITHANKLNGRIVPNRDVVIIDSFSQQDRTSIQVWETDNHADRFYYLNAGTNIPHVTHGSKMDFVVRQTTGGNVDIHHIDVAINDEDDIETMCRAIYNAGFSNKQDVIFVLAKEGISETGTGVGYESLVNFVKGEFNQHCATIKGTFLISTGNSGNQTPSNCTDTVPGCNVYIKGIMKSNPAVSGKLHVVPVTSFDSDTGYISIARGPGPEAFIQNNTVTMFGQYDWITSGTTSTSVASFAGLLAIHSSINNIPPQASLDQMLQRTWRGQPYIGGRGVPDNYAINLLAGHHQSGAWGDHPQAYGRGVLDIGKAFEDGNTLHSWLYQTQGKRALWSGGRNVRHAEYDADYDAVRVEVPFNTPSIRYAPRSGGEFIQHSLGTCNYIYDSTEVLTFDKDYISCTLPDGTILEYFHEDIGTAFGFLGTDGTVGPYLKPGLNGDQYRDTLLRINDVMDNEDLYVDLWDSIGVTDFITFPDRYDASGYLLSAPFIKLSFLPDSAGDTAEARLTALIDNAYHDKDYESILYYKDAVDRHRYPRDLSSDLDANFVTGVRIDGSEEEYLNCRLHYDEDKSDDISGSNWLECRTTLEKADSIDNNLWVGGNGSPYNEMILDVGQLEDLSFLDTDEWSPVKDVKVIEAFADYDRGSLETTETYLLDNEHIIDGGQLIEYFVTRASDGYHVGIFPLNEFSGDAGHLGEEFEGLYSYILDAESSITNMLDIVFKGINETIHNKVKYEGKTLLWNEHADTGKIFFWSSSEADNNIDPGLREATGPLPLTSYYATKAQ